MRRSKAGSPAPRCRRGGNVSAIRRTCAVSLIRLAATRPGSIRLEPASRIAVGSPDLSTSRICSKVDCLTRGGVVTVAAGTGPSDSSQHTSAGRISVATCPGGPKDAATASAASVCSVVVESAERIHPEMPRAMLSMSLCNGASYCAW